MADTSIEWTDKTWNPTRGCALVSPGCTNCYAMKFAHRFSGKGGRYEGLTRLRTKGGPVWTGKVRSVPKMLEAPLRWKKPRKVFVNSMSDLFHEDVSFDFIAAVFAVMAATPHHTYQVLTKRQDRMAQVLKLFGAGGEAVASPLRTLAMAGTLGKRWKQGSLPVLPAWPLPNVWLGVSVEDQQRAVERIPQLLRVPAAVRFLSVEPMLGPVDLTHLDADGAGDRDFCQVNALTGQQTDMGRPCSDVARIDWVIVGGESGNGARPVHPDWVRALRDQCRAAGAAFFFKQWGSWEPFYDMEKDDPDGRRVPEESHKVRRLNVAGGQGFHGDRVVYFRKVAKKKASAVIDGSMHREWPASSGGAA